MCVVGYHFIKIYLQTGVTIGKINSVLTNWLNFAVSLFPLLLCSVEKYIASNQFILLDCLQMKLVLLKIRLLNITVIHYITRRLAVPSSNYLHMG